MLDEPFTQGQSCIHRLDPRVRIAASALFSCLVAVANSFPVLAIACVIAVGLVLLARLDLAAVGRRLSVVLGFLILLWLILPLTYEGDPVGQLGPLVWHRPGMALAARISLKSFAILAAFTALLATMTVSTLGHALDRMGMPTQTHSSAVDVLPVYLRYRAGVPPFECGHAHPGLSAADQSAHLSQLCLSGGHVVCACRGARRTGASGHAVPGISGAISYNGPISQACR